MKKYLNAENIKEITKSIDNVKDNREEILAVVDQLNIAATDPDFNKVILANNGVEKIEKILNYYPTDAEIKEKAGLLLQKLVEPAKVKEYMEEFTKISAKFDPAKPETVLEMRKANLKLANLLTIPVGDNPELVQGMVPYLLKASTVDDPAFLASYMILNSQLDAQGEKCKLVLREAGIPEKICKSVLESPKLINYGNGVINELALKVMNNSCSMKLNKIKEKTLGHTSINEINPVEVFDI